MLDFDTVINRVDTDSYKWDAPSRAIGRKDVIQMGCADMDFKTAPEISQALQEAAAQALYGYTTQSKTYQEGIIKWYQERHNCTIAKESILFVSRIVIAASVFVEAFSRPGEKVILNSPYYPPLDQVTQDNGRVAIEPPLVEKDGRYVIDFEELERRVDSKTKLMIFVSPHNPTTRIWTREELQQVADFCVKHDLLLFVDEIHCDFAKKGHTFISMADIKGQIQDRLIVVNAPAKTFNVMGCHISYLIIPNAKIRNQMERELERLGETDCNFFGNALMKVAYQKCGYYVDEVNPYIDANEEYLRAELPKLFPKAKIKPREGTYLLWVDLNDEFASEEAMMDFFINEASVNFHRGSLFNHLFKGFIRINMGCPRATLQEVIKRIKDAQEKAKS